VPAGWSADRQTRTVDSKTAIRPVILAGFISMTPLNFHILNNRYPARLMLTSRPNMNYNNIEIAGSNYFSDSAKGG
jgi:hypothetical protein